jgi:hypothetical protein
MDEMEIQAHMRTMVRQEIAKDPEIVQNPWTLADIIVKQFGVDHPGELVDEDHAMRAMYDLGLAQDDEPEPPS